MKKRSVWKRDPDRNILMYFFHLFKLENISNKVHFYFLASFSLFVLLVAISISILTIFRTNQSIEELDRAHDINMRIETISSIMKGAETAERGYIISKSQELLQPYYESPDLVKKELEELTAILDNDVVQTRNLNMLRIVINKKIEVMEADKIRFDETGEMNQLSKLQIILGNIYMDGVRNEIKKMRNVEAKRLSQIKKRTYQRSQQSIYVIISTSGFSVLLLVFILNILNRQYRQKLVAETNLLQSQNLLKVEVNKLNLSNKELEQFAYIASHDLQEPLRKIISFGEQIELKLSKTGDEDTLNFLFRLKKSAYRMKKLITDLLSYSRITRASNSIEDINLSDVFQQIVEELEETIDYKNATIETGIFWPKIQGDPTQLRQLFQNLLTNALKFGKENEPPTIKMWYEMHSLDEIIEKNWDLGFHLIHKEYLCIYVKDSGIGFEQQYKDRIFTIFQRLHGRAEYEGSGIGLAICKSIVENHLGFITAEGSLNEGATFIVGLPKRDIEIET